ncbi:phosphatase PAP2 family protein [Bradyrhizobium commune]|uniref:Phosphatase PAP2 family protein n=1 Tax=Bradyrhizobium commune TaxID=83627 RepID=A0A7S9GY42_9BRAD|nr:phosphatase PAP2 family protein [Bradyrhizobium commune]QPF89200.1 phosphatase PAP2 family protein [Bradyrhizobium commune]
MTTFSPSKFWRYATLGAALLPAAARADSIPSTPPVNFTNSSTASVGSTIVNLLDSYTRLMLVDPKLRNGVGVMEQNYLTVIRMTQERTPAQTLAAVHDDRTAQPYSVLNGLGPLTSYFMTGIGSSTTATPPTSLTPTSYPATTLQDYDASAHGINYLNSATIGFAAFGDGTATPLSDAANFLNTTIRNNASTEPPKRTFERYMGSTAPVVNPASIAAGVISPLDARYGNYNAVSNKAGLSATDTAQFVVPTYFSSFSVPIAYYNTLNWVRGYTATAALVAANGGNPITVPDVGSFDASGNFTPTQFNAGDYVPGIGTAPRPFRLSAKVKVPTLLWQIANGTNPYGDGAFVSGHTNLAYNQALGLAFLVPQQFESLLVRAADLGNNRILAGMHSPLDVIGGRIEATAIVATNIYGALYGPYGNRLDWTNSANASAYAVYQAHTKAQKYLAQSCGTSTVEDCLKRLRGTHDDDGHDRRAGRDHDRDDREPDYNLDPDDSRGYTYRMSYGLALASSMKLPETVPVQAQVLLLTRFPYATDEQRTEILRNTALPSGFALLDGNTWDGWGRLNLYAAVKGQDSFFRAVRAATTR